VDECTADRLIQADGRLGHIPGVEIAIVIDGRAKNGPGTRCRAGRPPEGRRWFSIAPRPVLGANEDIRARGGIRKGSKLTASVAKADAVSCPSDGEVAGGGEPHDVR
jgi:hypothetical protein